MKYDKDLRISLGTSRWSTSWPTTDMKWSEFCARLKTPVRGTETLGEFLKMTKADQDSRKDVGGYVGGVIEGERRKVGNVRSRDLVTLDLDNIPAGKTKEILSSVQLLGCSAAIYSTRKHREAAPRLRIILPTDREMTIEEYEPIARRVAKLIGIDYCDPTTFELNRLMFWPSVSSDSEYVCEVYDQPFLKADNILRMYGDWKDASQWPTAEGEKAVEKHRLTRQADPTTKQGPVGAFCRTYTVTEAMEAFLPGIYTPTQTEGRYTYTGGSTAGGAIVYDGDKWMYSHHATDPCSGILVNAFDLVRLHKFADLDEEAKPDTPVNRLPSFKAMEEFALADKSVSRLLAKERQEEAEKAFEAVPEGMSDWRELLRTDRNGNYKKSIDNLKIILQHDPRLSGRIVTDEFAGFGMAIGPLPWNDTEGRRLWTDTDDAGVQWYVETCYGISSKDKLLAALAVVGSHNKTNEVKDYLLGLEWDGVHRVDTLLSDYLGTEDNEYTRAVIRKALCAAVGRAVIGGIKFDYMLIISGRQGLGKSTFLGTLGKEWFSDSLVSFSGKEAAELLRGTWINEIGELSAMTKQETADVKQFLSKQVDIYRAAYGRRTEKHPRRCVFFGTTNDTEFLRDATGSRRFWPVDAGMYDPKLSVWDDLPKQVDQIWAEAVMYWKAGEQLYLTGKIEQMALRAQEEHRESYEWEGQIMDYLDKNVPAFWEKMDIGERRQYLNGNVRPESEEKLEPIDRVCIMQIWVECLGGDQRYLKPQDRTKIRNIMNRVPGWEKIKTAARYGPYGVQKGFRRK